MKLRVIFFCLKSVTIDPNNALNIFSCFCNLEKDKLFLCVLHLYLSYNKFVRILVILMMKNEKSNMCSEGTTHK